MVELHFLARLKALGLKILRRGFHEVVWVGKISSNQIQLDHSKTTSFRKEEGIYDKGDKMQQKVEGVQPEVDVTFSDFFYAHFLFNWIFDPPYLMRFW